MGSLENGEYKFRNQAGYQTPAGLSNFGTWFTPLSSSTGKKVVRPADLDFMLQSNRWNAAIAGEFKPAGFGELNFAQSSNIIWVSKVNDRCYGIYIEDHNYNVRSDDKLDMEEMYKITVYNRGKQKTQFATLEAIYLAIERWWDTGVLTVTTT